MKFKLLKNKEKLKTNIAKSNTNDNKRTREKSTGRSMVEMLGVLAIIGVLSIGGIQGYTIAMKRYRANEVADIMIKYATITYTAFQNFTQNNDVSIEHFGNYNANAPIYFFDSDLSDDSNDYDPCREGKCGIIEFQNAGLGTLPNGVNSIHVSCIYSAIDANGETTYYNNKGIPASDYVGLHIVFKDSELCKTTFSVLSGYTTIDGSDEPDNLAGCNDDYSPAFDKAIPVH